MVGHNVGVFCDCHGRLKSISGHNVPFCTSICGINGVFLIYSKVNEMNVVNYVLEVQL